jgi:hypothetical protein
MIIKNNKNFLKTHDNRGNYLRRGRGRRRKEVLGDEYDQCTLHTCMKI